MVKPEFRHSLHSFPMIFWLFTMAFHHGFPQIFGTTSTPPTFFGHLLCTGISLAHEVEQLQRPSEAKGAPCFAGIERWSEHEKTSSSTMEIMVSYKS